MDVSEKVVIVTGASSGIGAAIAVKLAKAGGKVAIVGRNEKRLNSVAEKCEHNGVKPLAIVADVSSQEDANKIINDTLSHFGKIDVLVNNAGISGIASIFDKNVMQTFDRVLSTNLRAIVYLTHLAAHHLVQTKGNIINISSIAAHKVASQTSFSYCTSKAALDHYSRCMALEFATKGVRVNCINPGPVNTNIHDTIPLAFEQSEDKLNQLMKNATALHKITDPEEIADLVLYLASDKARSITGSSYNIDCGLMVKCAFDF